MTPRPGPAGTASRPRSSDERLGEIAVGSEKALRRGAVTGQREAGERRDREQGRTADSRFEHAAGDGGDARRHTHVVHVARLGNAQPRRLDAHYAARAESDHVGCDRRARDRLVEADRCAQPAGQLRVIEHAIGRERLFERLQAERVQGRQLVDTCQRVAAVGVGRERERRPRVLRVPRAAPRPRARRYLAFHTRVTGVAVSGDERRNDAVVVVQPDRDSGVHMRTRCAEVRRQRDTVALQPPIQHRALEGGAGRVVSANVVVRPAVEQPRQQVITQREPCTVDRVGGVCRRGERRALAPAGGRLSLQAHDERVLGRRIADCRAERFHERHPHTKQLGLAEHGRRA